MINDKSPFAIVTGAASGIGLATAETLRRDGWAVMIVDVDKEKGKAAARRYDLEFSVCDVTRVADLRSLFSDVSRLDALVNNAGFSGATAPLTAQSMDDWHKALNTNLTGPFIACQLAIPILEQSGGGSIVNMASVAGRIGYENRSPYAASKWGILGLTATLAREVGRKGIRVNAILPSAVRGDRMDRVISHYATANGISHKQAESYFIARNATGRYVEASEIAETVAFLLSDKAPSITGQFIGVDGGFQ